MTKVMNVKDSQLLKRLVGREISQIVFIFTECVAAQGEDLVFVMNGWRCDNDDNDGCLNSVYTEAPFLQKGMTPR